MSLAFQNADSVKQALFEELQNLLSSDTSVLQSAEQKIKHLEYTEGMYMEHAYYNWILIFITLH